MRAGGGTKSGPFAVVTRATNSEIAAFAAPSFHDGNGSTAATGDPVVAGATARSASGERPWQPTAISVTTHNAKAERTRTLCSPHLRTSAWNRGGPELPSAPFSAVAAPWRAACARNERAPA